MKKVITLVVMIVSACVTYAEDSDIVKVKGKGIGADKVEALKDAYRDAIERAVGLYVDAEQMVENEELVKDQILTHSNAYIEKCKLVKESRAESGLITVTILAEVRKRALTQKIKGVMPDQTVALSEINKDLHAQIVTDLDANANAVAIIKNELGTLAPLKQLMKFTLQSKTPIVESIKEDPQSVRLWYPVQVEVDQNLYFKEFAPRWTRILDQIKTAPAKRLDLQENKLFTEAYNEMIAEEFGTSRKARKGVMTRCDMPRDTKWPHYEFADCLYQFGLALNEEFQGFKFLNARIAGKSYVLHSCHALPVARGSIPDSFNRRNLYDSGHPDEKLIIRAFRTSCRNYSLLEEVSGDCDFYIGLVTSASKNKLGGSLYKIPQDCIDEILTWQHLTACGTLKGYQYQETAPEVDVLIRFMGADATEVTSTSVSFRNLELLNFGCVCLEEPENSNDHYVGGKRLWLITPLVGSVAKRFVKWISIDIPKDDVAKIADAIISVEE